jgi:hypothetical protein
MLDREYLFKEMAGIGYTTLGRYRDYVVFGRGKDRVAFQELQPDLYEFHKTYVAEKYIPPKVGLEDCLGKLQQYYGGVKDEV